MFDLINADISGGDGKFTHGTIGKRGDLGWPGAGYLIQPVSTMHRRVLSQADEAHV